MFSQGAIIFTICLYVSFLFLMAIWAEHKTAKGQAKFVNNSLVYSLSLGVYCTAWTYYGSVGKAATSGMLFLPIYLGPTMSIILWWFILRKLVRIKNSYRITSIADFISARYQKSHALAFIATLGALIGILPYIALQIKAIMSTYGLLIHAVPPSGSHTVGFNESFFLISILILFTIVIGARRLDPTERHQGMVFALAVECVIKLIAFLAVGVFVAFFMYHGFGDIFQQAQENQAILAQMINYKETSSYITWITYLILAMSAIMFLPRQFHVSVVENSNEKHIRTAMWFFPAYMFLLNIFVYPIAMAGLLSGLPLKEADTFVLSIPFHNGQRWLSLLAFLGGFSASIGMVMIASTAVPIMVTNHMLLPLITSVKQLNFLKRHLLKCRWFAIAAFILIGYWFERAVGASYMLVNIGMISFAAVFQFAPSVIGGLFWKKANKTGAILGLSAGLLVWFYTLMIPSFAKSGWLPASLLQFGPLGIGFLNPERLFGISILDSLSHGFFWSSLFNISFFILGSLYFRQEKGKDMAEEFINILERESKVVPSGAKIAYIDLAAKLKIIKLLLLQFFGEKEADSLLEKILESASLTNKAQISIIELSDLNNRIERQLAGSIGTATAHRLLSEGGVFSNREYQELQDAYAEILVNLKLTPEELKRKIDYYQEKEVLVVKHSRELEAKIEELEKNIHERKKAEQALQVIQDTLERRVEDRTVDIVKANDKLRLEIIERQRAEEELKRNYDTQNLLNSMLNLSLKDVSTEELLNYVLNLIISIRWLSFDARGIIFLTDNDNPEVLAMKASIGVSETVKKACQQVPFNKCTCGKAAQLKTAQFANSVDEGHEIRCKDVALHRHYCMPILSAEKVIGVINMYVRENQAYNKKDENFLGMVADVLAVIIIRKHAEKELKQAYEQLTRAQSQLVQSAKMASVGILAGGVAHEINNPLTGVLNNVQLIKMIVAQKKEFKIEDFKEMLDVIEESANRCTKITRSLLSFSRASKGSYQQTSINETVEKVLVLIEHELGLQNIAIDKKLQPDLPLIPADSQLIQQAIFDIMVNAKWAIQKKAAPGQGGTITIKTEYQPKDNTIFLSIADTGIGIPKEDIEKMFEPFFTTKEVGEGTGLGLSLVYNIVKEHKGTIVAESEVGIGTVFKISLPVAS